MAEHERKCGLHPESKAFYCCMTPECTSKGGFICAQCVISGSHKDHKVFYCRDVDEEAKTKITAELEKASKKKAKTLETTELLMEDPHVALKGDLEDIVFNSKYITMVRQKLKDYEQHIQDLNKQNKELMNERKKYKDESMVMTEVQKKELTDAKGRVGKLETDTKASKDAMETEIAKLKERAELNIKANNEKYNERESILVNKYREMELQNKEFLKFKDNKDQIEKELKELRSKNEELKKSHQQDLEDRRKLHIREIDELKNQHSETEILEKNKARSQAQKDLVITQETHELLVQELRGDRKTQKEEIDRIKKQEDKLSMIETSNQLKM
jgi:hypothetical protein